MIDSEILVAGFVEEPVFFRAGDETLFGTFVRPEAGPLETAVLFAAGGWYGTSTARNRPLVRMGRALAAGGWASFSFDYRGVGESTGTSHFSLTTPMWEDVAGAARWLRNAGVKRIVLVGICYGTRTALKVVQDIDELAGVALVSMPPTDAKRFGGGLVRQAQDAPLKDLARRALHPAALKSLTSRDGRSTLSRAVRARLTGSAGKGGGNRGQGPMVPKGLMNELDAIVGRRVPLLFLYSDTAPHFAEFRALQDGPLGRLLERGGSLVEVTTVGADIENFTRVHAQDAVTDAIVRWVGSVLPREPAT